MADWKPLGGLEYQTSSNTITMTMSPIRDALQFVIGPLHEYTHALQTAHATQKPSTVIRWVIPDRQVLRGGEGSAVLVCFSTAI